MTGAPSTVVVGDREAQPRRRRPPKRGDSAASQQSTQASAEASPIAHENGRPYPRLTREQRVCLRVRIHRVRMRDIGSYGMCEQRQTKLDKVLRQLMERDGTEIRSVDSAPNQYDIWNRENIVSAMQDWAAAYGSPPVSREWRGGRPVGYPHSSTVVYYFGSFSMGLQAAGYGPPEGQLMCCECRVYKPDEQFYRDRRRRSKPRRGRYARCKRCLNKKRRDARRGNDG